MMARIITLKPGLVGFPESMKKVGKFELIAAMSFALTLLLPLAAYAAGKTPHLEYGVIKNNNNAPPSKSTHPPPANHPTRGCNAENYCRHLTLSAENPSGTRFEAALFVEVGVPINGSAPGTEAIAAGIAAWSLNNTKFGRLSVSILNQTANAESARMLLLQAVSRGIARLGLDVQYRSASMSTEDMETLPPVDGNITITVDAASKHIELKFITHAESFGETDIIQILEYAKAILPAIHK